MNFSSHSIPGASSLLAAVLAQQHSTSSFSSPAAIEGASSRGDSVQKIKSENLSSSSMLLLQPQVRINLLLSFRFFSWPRFGAVGWYWCWACTANGSTLKHFHQDNAKDWWTIITGTFMKFVHCQSNCPHSMRYPREIRYIINRVTFVMPSLPPPPTSLSPTVRCGFPYIFLEKS